MENEINIVYLNFDILTLIYKQLDTFDDKVNFASVHRNLFNVFAYHSHKDVRKKLILNGKYGDKKVISHWRFFLYWWGPSINHIISKFNCVDSGELVEIAAKYCPNLEVIQILDIGAKDNLSQLADNLPRLEKLREIDIKIKAADEYEASEKTGLNLDKVIESLQKLIDLRKLNIGNHYLKKAELIQLNQLRALEELSIVGLETPDDLNNISTVLGNLQRLTLKSYPNTDVLSQLADYCINLKHLSLDDLLNGSFTPNYSTNWRNVYFSKLISLQIWKGDDSCDFLCNLDSRYDNQIQILDMPYTTVSPQGMERITRLRALRVLSCNEIFNDSVVNLVQTRLQQLYVGTINHNITQTNILLLIKSCQTLRFLDINLQHIDINFLNELLYILEMNNVDPDHPFVFIVPERIYYQYVRSEFASNPKSKLMELRFE